MKKKRKKKNLLTIFWSIGASSNSVKFSRSIVFFISSIITISKDSSNELCRRCPTLDLTLFVLLTFSLPPSSKNQNLLKKIEPIDMLLRCLEVTTPIGMDSSKLTSTGMMLVPTGNGIDKRWLEMSRSKSSKRTMSSKFVTKWKAVLEWTRWWWGLHFDTFSISTSDNGFPVNFGSMEKIERISLMCCWCWRGRERKSYYLLLVDWK